MGKKYQFKLTMMGDGGVGKTSIKNRFLTGEFTNKYLTTLGVDFSSHSMKVDDKDIFIQIWDVAGQEIFSSIRESYFQGAKGALIVFDVTRPETLENLLEGWIRPFFKVLSLKPPIIICGNKCDLTNERILKTETGQRFVYKVKQEFNLTETPLYIETSALEGININTAFTTITRSVLSKIKS